MRTAIAATLAAALAALMGSVSSAATSPVAAASEQLQKASSYRVTMAIDVGTGGVTITLGAHGLVLPHRHEASFSFGDSKVIPELNGLSIIETSRFLYLHDPALAKLAPKGTHLKPWVAESLGSVSGASPWNPAAAAALAQSQHLTAVGPAIDAGMPVERYAARVDLAKALALNPQLHALLTRLGGSLSLLSAPATIDYDVAHNGYLREVSETLGVHARGTTLSVGVTMLFGAFDQRASAVRLPPAGEIMTAKKLAAIVGKSVGIVA